MVVPSSEVRVKGDLTSLDAMVRLRTGWSSGGARKRTTEEEMVGLTSSCPLLDLLVADRNWE